MDPLREPRPVIVIARRRRRTRPEVFHHRQIATALKRCGRLLRWNQVDLVAGGWVELKWPGVRLLADRDGARQLEPEQG